jgi:Carbon-nitrogen hydrolase
MDRKATLAKVEELMADPAVRAADLVVFPEAFVPGTPIWIDGARIWDGDEQWFAMLADQAVVVPSETTDRLGAAAREAGVYLVIGINERESTGSTIYNTLLYFDADGNLLGKHRKLMPTGSERTVWGMGDGSTLDTYSTPFGRIGGLICWENYMPLARFYLYSQGVDVWVAPTLARGDAWVARPTILSPSSRSPAVSAWRAGQEIGDAGHIHATVVPVGQSTAPLVVAHQREPAGELDQPVPPHRALPVVIEVAEPIRHLHQRGAIPHRGVRQSHTVRGSTEPDLLLRRPSARHHVRSAGAFFGFRDLTDELISATVHSPDQPLAAAVVADRPAGGLDPAGQR